MNAICLCLDKREEHWKRLQKECKNQYINFIPFICGDGSNSNLKYDWIDKDVPEGLQWNYSAVGHVKNHYNAFSAHQEMARRSLNYIKWTDKPILFLEDDSKILDRYEDHIEGILENIFDYDIIYLGYWLGREKDINIEKDYQHSCNYEILNTPLGGLHGAILGIRAVEAIIDMKPIDPVDAQLNRLNLKRYIYKPKLISTINTYSYTEGINIERDYL